MIENLKTIYTGHATVIKNKEYFSAKNYIEPFIEKLKPYTEDIICFVKVADQLAIDDSICTVYNKVLIMGIFPKEYNITINQNNTSEIYRRVVCMSYALDVKNPTCKFYTGVIDNDLNFYAFGNNCCNIQKIEPETALDYSFVNTIINNGLSDLCELMLNQIVNITVDKNTLISTLGEWVDSSIKKEYINDAGKVKLSVNIPIDAYKKLVIDKDSNYYSDNQFISLLNILRSFISQITEDEKDIINRYEKTQLINNILKL